MSDPYQLRRFVDAQDPIFEHVLAELRAGLKQRHWMWFVFPQLKGLGSSSMAQRYGISSRGEADKYLEHPILGPRLMQCTRLVNLVEGRSIEEIFGSIDAMKFRSSMTLFAQIGSEISEFDQALRTYFGGQVDQLTVDRLSSDRSRSHP